MVSHDKRKTVTKTCGFWTACKLLLDRRRRRRYLLFIPDFESFNHFSKLSGKTKCNERLVELSIFTFPSTNEDIKANEKLTELQEKVNKNDTVPFLYFFFPSKRFLSILMRSNKLISEI